MNEKILKSLAMKSMSAMLTVVLFSVVLTQYNNVTIYANETLAKVSGDSKLTNDSLNSVSSREIMEQARRTGSEINTEVITGDVIDHIGNNYLKITKSSQNKLEIVWEDLYVTRKVRVCMKGLEEKSITKKDILCKGSTSDSLEDVSISYEYDPNTFLYTAIIELQFDDIYAQKVYEDKDNIYLVLKNPHDVYNKIIVVDAGHGGNDIGTYTDDMRYYEKDINLSIVLYLKELLDQEKGIKVYYTRLSDEKVYLNPRLDLANDLKADILVSIHCNSSEYATARGSEVLYSSKGQKHLMMKSNKLAEICLDELVKEIKIPNRGIVKSNDIYIVGNSSVPVALIEVGFMSNKKDMKFLIKEKNRKKTARGVYNGIKKAFEQLDKITKEGAENGK